MCMHDVLTLREDLHVTALERDIQKCPFKRNWQLLGYIHVRIKITQVYEKECTMTVSMYKSSNKNILTYLP